MIGAAGTVSPRRSRIKEGWWEPRLPNLNREENSERNRSDRALRNKAPRSLPERRPREQCAMTASLEGKAKSLSFAVRSRRAEVATKKFNVFAEIGRFNRNRLRSCPSECSGPGVCICGELYLVMICAPAAVRPAFRAGVRVRNGRKHCEDGADDHIFPCNKLGVCAGEEGRHSLRVARP